MNPSTPATDPRNSDITETIARRTAELLPASVVTPKCDNPICGRQVDGLMGFTGRYGSVHSGFKYEFVCLACNARQFAYDDTRPAMTPEVEVMAQLPDFAANGKIQAMPPVMKSFDVKTSLGIYMIFATSCETVDTHVIFRDNGDTVAMFAINTIERIITPA